MMKKGLVTTILALVVIIVTGCVEVPSLVSTPAAEEVNFRLLLSDESNAINDFDALWVTITRIGVKQGGESGGWIERKLDPPERVDLTELKGNNATEIWSGKLNDGTYTKVFIYVSIVEGVLAGGEVNMKLPSGKLQISKPFEVTSGEVTEFVYDITVIKTGQSGKYILKPQIAQSGPDHEFNEVAPKGKPEKTGKPEDKGKPEKTGKPEGQQETEEVALIGIIEAIDGTTWTMTIDGETRTVDVSEAEIVGEPAVDLQAVVRGTLVDDTIVAGEIEIKKMEE